MKDKAGKNVVSFEDEDKEAYAAGGKPSTRLTPRGHEVQALCQSVYVCMYVCMYVRMYVCVYACMYVCTMYGCMYVSLYVCVEC